MVTEQDHGGAAKRRHPGPREPVREYARWDRSEKEWKRLRGLKEACLAGARAEHCEDRSCGETDLLR
jgi:hypothetical protein